MRETELPPLKQTRRLMWIHVGHFFSLFCFCFTLNLPVLVLTPFQTRSTFVRDWRLFGYTYPQFVRSSPVVTLEGQTPPSAPELISELFPFLDEDLAETVGVIEPIDTGAGEKRSGYYEWVVRIRASHYALLESYSILVFINPSPNEPLDYESSAYVGSVSAFVNPSIEECKNCRENAQSIIEGFVYLNHTLVSRAGLKTLKPGTVEPWVKEKIVWTAQKVSSALPVLTRF
jgi:hypothetical protein